MPSKIVCIIEARMRSSRLPGKVLLPVKGQTMLGYQIDRVKQAGLIDEIVLATTTDRSDDCLEELAYSKKIGCFRGSEEDVLSRVVGAGLSRSADVLVELTGDCPVIDPEIIEQAIQIFLRNDVEYVTNGHYRSYPDGMDVQVMAMDALSRSATMTDNALDREHVTLFIRKHPELFRTIHLIAPKGLREPELGLTLDEEDDYRLLVELINEHEKEGETLSCSQIIEVLDGNNILRNINSHVQRKGDT